VRFSATLIGHLDNGRDLHKRSGMFFYGRDAFRERHAAIFRTVFKGSRQTLRIAKLRFIRPVVAIADIDAEVGGYATLPSGLTAMPDGALRTKPLMVQLRP